jgi:hypothetical protein
MRVTVDPVQRPQRSRTAPAHIGTYALPRLRVQGAHIAGYALPILRVLTVGVRWSGGWGGLLVGKLWVCQGADSE